MQQDLEEYGSVEQQPLMEGRQMVMVIGAEEEVSRRTVASEQVLASALAAPPRAACPVEATLERAKH